MLRRVASYAAPRFGVSGAENESEPERFGEDARRARDERWRPGDDEPGRDADRGGETLVRRARSFASPRERDRERGGEDGVERAEERVRDLEPGREPGSPVVEARALERRQEEGEERGALAARVVTGWTARRGGRAPGARSHGPARASARASAYSAASGVGFATSAGPRTRTAARATTRQAHAPRRLPSAQQLEAWDGELPRSGRAQEHGRGRSLRGRVVPVSRRSTSRAPRARAREHVGRGERDDGHGHRGESERGTLACAGARPARPFQARVRQRTATTTRSTSEPARARARSRSSSVASGPSVAAWRSPSFSWSSRRTSRAGRLASRGRRRRPRARGPSGPSRAAGFASPRRVIGGLGDPLRELLARRARGRSPASRRAGFGSARGRRDRADASVEHAADGVLEARPRRACRSVRAHAATVRGRPPWGPWGRGGRRAPASSASTAARPRRRRSRRARPP